MSQDTREKALDVAERLVQTRGYNGFSYADVAAEVGVTKATLHYHFAGKRELGTALIDRYSARFVGRMSHIDDARGDARQKLLAFAGIYGDVLREGRMCLCGMLAADFETLPESMQAELLRFFDETHAWLTKVVAEGVEGGDLRIAGAPEEVAQAILGGLEGAMLVARPYRDVARFEAAARQLLASLLAS
ncbi:MAG: TetR/AcrR family transcriptional regulator [Thermoleophilia bacterium]|nr:TetR/AcrR family transcriptional regulator [Gaiellaceae bacterium]MDW8338163.1 TetR/AcrR family transcriptional regulator [Thermoleophilia bacterium]